MSPVANTAPPDPVQWISLATAVRMLGNRDASTVKSILLGARVRVDAMPGCRLRFAREDVARLVQG